MNNASARSADWATGRTASPITKSMELQISHDLLTCGHDGPDSFCDSKPKVEVFPPLRTGHPGARSAAGSVFGSNPHRESERCDAAGAGDPCGCRGGCLRGQPRDEAPAPALRDCNAAPDL